jgi:plasmid stabilization system protein ParE
MSVIILPDAQNDLLSLQDYMLDQWGEIEWLKAEDEIFEKLHQVDAGNYPGTAVKELTTVGIFEFQHVFTSHHKLVYRKISENIYVYAIARHKQDFLSLLMRRLLKR